MYDFDINNKVPGIYWLKQPIDDLKIKITIRPQTTAINLPKYEEFMNISTTADLEKIENNKNEEYIFKWQEKVFSTWEINNYSEIHNCITETQLDHHNTLNSIVYKPQKVFTYIHKDYYLPLPLDLKKTQYQTDNFNLLSCFENLNLGGRFSGSFGGTSSMRQLYRSEDSMIDKSSWIAMHVVFDNSKYADDYQLLMKQEYILLSLYYNTIDNYLIISPDVNDLMQNPYNISTDTCSGNFEYGVEIIFAELESDQELNNLLNKLYTKWQKKHKHLIQFIQPAVGKEKFYVNIEIISGTDFDMDNIYIEYEIKIPEDMKCECILNGRTHVSKVSQHGDDMLWTYGHMIELDIDIDVELAISTDWWGRHRTEGYCYLPISLIPGYYKEALRCSRPEEMNKVEANTRRFFVGGCHLINDLEVLSKPQLQNANFTYTATGNLHLRYGIIKQANSPDTELAGVPPGVPTSSALLQGAEAVLREYSHARARLDAATKHIDCGT